MKPILASLAAALLVLPAPEASADDALPVTVMATGLRPRALRAALTRELGRPIVVMKSDTACHVRCVWIRRDRDLVTVDVIADDGEARHRTVSIADDPSALIETAVFLVGNLMRDEASTLAAGFATDESEAVGMAPSAPPAPLGVPNPMAAAPPVPADDLHPAAAASPDAAAAPVPVASLASRPRLDPGPAALAPNAVVSPASMTPSPALADPESVSTSVGFGLIPFLSIAAGRGDRATAALDVVVGVRDRLGFGAAGVASVVRRDVAGMQMAGVAATARSVLGGQVAGVAVNAGDVRGFQMAGVAANAAAVDGFQIAGVAAHADRVLGLQAAGVASVSRRGAALQLAGVAAVAGGDVGVQISGVANVAGGTVRGAQIGVVNVAGASNGVQIGLVNVARRGAGAAFGLINVNPGGRTELEATVDDDSLGAVMLRHGGRRFHNVYGLGGRARGDQLDGELTANDVWLYGLGFGPTWYAGTTTIDVEAMAWHVMYGDQRPWGDRAPSDLNLLAQLRVAVGVPIGSAALVMGASANAFITTDESRPTLGARAAPTAAAMDNSEVQVTVWPAIFAGVRI